MAHWVKNPFAVQETGDVGLIPQSGRSPGVGSGNPLQYFCLENPVDRGAWRALVHGVTESNMTEPLTLALFLFQLLTFTIRLKITDFVKQNTVSSSLTRSNEKQYSV